MRRGKAILDAARFFWPDSQLVRVDRTREDEWQTMSRYPHDPSQGNAEASREQFADGSALVTCPNGSQLILESALAKSAVLCEGSREISTNHHHHPASRCEGLCG